MGASKYTHSTLVSKIMRVLAEKFGEDETEWELVGLLHDLDYEDGKKVGRLLYIKGDYLKIIRETTKKEKEEARAKDSHQLG